MMKWNFGQTYKEIRKSKNLSQQEICGEEISRVALSKIENSKAIPNITHMMFLLDQIDMTVDEFMYICNLYHPSERQSLLIEANNLLVTPTTEQLKVLITRCSTYLELNDDVPIKNLKDVLELFLFIRTNGIQRDNLRYQDLVHKIWLPLQERDEWYISDIRLLNAILHYFPVETLEKLSSYIFKNLEKYKNYRNIKNDQKTILENLATIYLKEGYQSQCETILLKLLELCKEMKRYDGVAFAKVRLGICQCNSSLIEQGKQMLILCEEARLLDIAETEIERYYTK
ncbi:helix-turn-helix domain-containing protein [Streptococcus porci]